MISILGTRYGDIDCHESAVLHFEHGIAGFPWEKEFVVLECEGRDNVAVLQSVRTPWLSLPIMDGAALAPAYPNPPSRVLARRAGLPHDDLAVLVVLAVYDGTTEANLLAPLLVDLASRRGVQVLLDPALFAARFPLPRSQRGDDDATLPIAARHNAR